ncbi:hypothetical protein R1flu_017916 [Riccia fluitans]|uniref:CCAAT-binding factor domain-containing protein n=1 Tax=Riccia fluitans TaxID=41844 RepID=A0ABD1ZEK4_9MARC
MRSKSSKSNKVSKLLEETKQLGNDLLTSRSHLNNAPLLLNTLSNAKHPNAARAEALHSLQAFFVSLLRTGRLESGTHTAEEAKDGGNPEAIYKMWVRSKYQEFRKVVFRIACKESTTGLQVEALNSCMDLVRDERSGEFANSLYFRLCGAMLRCKDETNDILQVLTKKYFQYADVRYYTYVNLETFISRRLQKDGQVVDEAASSDGEDPGRKAVSFHHFVRNAYDVLSSVPPPSSEEEKDGDVVYWRHSADEGEKGSTPVRTGEKRKKDQVSSSKSKQSKPTNPKKRKSAFTKAWLSFLRLELPLDTYKKVLGGLHKQVIPYMSNPILLSDFLTLSYNMGGLISVMALSSLFVLITAHGLEYPDFYNKLYALLEPSIFVAKHRARFFELLDACLKSSHLPAYLAAAFAKKLGRLVLSAPPSGSVVVIALIHNILRRHPSVNHLVHRDGSQSVVAPAVEDGANQGSSTGSAKKVETEQASYKIGEGKLGVDPFQADEPDTAKTDALKSSLWEIDTLRRHYCPAVSRFVESLETDLTVRAKTTEMTISDFSSTSYATIFNEEVGRRLKTVPLAYYHNVPNTLFAESSFEGWSFQDEDQSHPKATGEPETNDGKEMTDTKVLGEVGEEAEQEGSEQDDGDEEEQDYKDSMDEEDSERYSDDSNGSRSRSEQSEGEGWPGPLLKRFRDRYYF